MRRLFVSGFCLLVASVGWGVGDKAARDWTIKNVSVSTTTVTAIPTTALSGRYKIVVQSLDAFDVYIGTSTAMTASTGFVLLKSSASIELPIPEGLTVYGLGIANATKGTLDVRIIEYK